MIKIKIRPEGIRMDGHANCSVNGQDIVCAAVSALTCNLINVSVSYTHLDVYKRQARAQGELRALIKQYDEMMNKDWETASEEQRCRIEQIRAQTERISSVTQSEDEDLSLIHI